MKNVLFIQCCFFVQILSAQHVNVKNRTDLNLHGRVKSIAKSSFFLLINDSIKGYLKGPPYKGIHDREDYFLQFDSTGNVLEYSEMDSEKTYFQTTRKFQYDSMNRISFESVNNIVIKKYFYDSLSQVKFIVWPESEYRKFRTDTKEYFFYAKKGGLLKRKKYEFTNFVDCDSVTVENVYESNGKILEATKFYNQRKVESIKYTYFSALGTTKIEFYEMGDDQKSPNYSYSIKDSIGNEIEFGYKYDFESEMQEKSVNKFNSFNDQILELKYRFGKIYEKVEFQYEYDKANNWIQKKVIVNSKPHCVHFRKIEYF